MTDHGHARGVVSSTAGTTKYDDEKSPAGKTDYHTMEDCHDVLSVLRAQA